MKSDFPSESFNFFLSSEIFIYPKVLSINFLEKEAFLQKTWLVLWQLFKIVTRIITDNILPRHTRIVGIPASLVAQRLKRLPARRETWVQSLGREDPLEKEMATHSSILAWRIPWTEEPGRLQSMGLQRVGHDWATSLSLSTWHHQAAHETSSFSGFQLALLRQTQTQMHPVFWKLFPTRFLPLKESALFTSCCQNKTTRPPKL